MLRIKGVHIRCHNQILSVFTTQDMRITDATTLTDGVAGDDRTIAVQCIPVLGILAHSEAQLFHQLGITTAFEVGEKITAELRLRLFLLFRCIGTYGKAQQQC